MFRMPERVGAVQEDGPSAVELAAIEREWPQIAADLAALDAQIRRLTVADRVDEVAVRRARRDARRSLRSVCGRGGEAA